jgi:hypothetical protein
MQKIYAMITVLYFRAGGDPAQPTMGSRLRGNDQQIADCFDGTRSDIALVTNPQLDSNLFLRRITRVMRRANSR